MKLILRFGTITIFLGSLITLLSSCAKEFAGIILILLIMLIFGIITKGKGIDLNEKYTWKDREQEKNLEGYLHFIPLIAVILTIIFGIVFLIKKCNT